MKDLIPLTDSSPVKERSGLSLSAMKSFVVGEKENKFDAEFGRNEKVMSFIHSLTEPGTYLYVNLIVVLIAYCLKPTLLYKSLDNISLPL